MPAPPCPPSFLPAVMERLQREKPFVAPATQLGLEARKPQEARSSKRKGADVTGPGDQAQAGHGGAGPASAASAPAPRATGTRAVAEVIPAAAPAPAAKQAKAKAHSKAAASCPTSAAKQAKAKARSKAEASCPVVPVGLVLPAALRSGDALPRSSTTQELGPLVAVYGTAQSYIQRAVEGKRKLVVAVQRTMTPKHKEVVATLMDFAASNPSVTADVLKQCRGHLLANLS